MNISVISQGKRHLTMTAIVCSNYTVAVRIGKGNQELESSFTEWTEKLEVCLEPWFIPSFCLTLPEDILYGFYESYPRADQQCYMREWGRTRTATLRVLRTVVLGRQFWAMMPISVSAGQCQRGTREGKQPRSRFAKPAPRLCKFTFLPFSCCLFPN